MIIHDGDELVVHHCPADSAYDLVTFVGIGLEPEARRLFLLRDFAASENINCFGVTTKRRGFYVTPEIETAIEAIRTARGLSHHPIVVVGQSMGGYAALKYARKLDASAVVAFSPQYSMDPDELGFSNEADAAIFRAAFSRFAILEREAYRGMGVRAEECCAKAFILYDPSMEDERHFVDIFHRKVPRARAIPFYRGGHALVDQLDSNAAIFKILYAAAAGDERAVADAVFDIQLKDGARSVHKDSTSNNALVHNLLQSGRTREAMAYFHLCCRKTLGAASGFAGDITFDRQSYDDHVARDPCLMISRHGLFLAYSVGGQCLLLSPSVFDGGDTSAVFLTRHGDTVRLSIVSAQAELDVHAAAARGPYHLLRDGDRLAVAGAEEVLGANKVLGADHAGRLDMRASGAEAAEWFVAVPVSRGGGLLDRGALNWFNSAIVGTGARKGTETKLRLLTRLLAAARHRQPRQPDPL